MASVTIFRSGGAIALRYESGETFLCFEEGGREVLRIALSDKTALKTKYSFMSDIWDMYVAAKPFSPDSIVSFASKFGKPVYVDMDKVQQAWEA